MLQTFVAMASNPLKGFFFLFQGKFFTPTPDSYWATDFPQN